MVLKQFKLNIRILVLSEIWWNKGYNCCFTDCVKSDQDEISYSVEAIQVEHLDTIFQWDLMKQGK